MTVSTGSREMEALRAMSSSAPAGAEKAHKEEKAAQEGGAFPEMLEGIQKEGSKEAAHAEGAVKAKEEKESAIAGGAKSLKSEDDAAELEAPLGIDAALLLQAAESPKVSSINIEIDVEGDAEKDAAAKLDGAPALAALGAAEGEKAFAGALSKAPPLEEGEETDAALHGGVKPLKKEAVDTPESLNATVTETEGEKAAEGAQEKALFSIRDLRSASRSALKEGAGDSASSQGSPYSSSADSAESRASANSPAGDAQARLPSSASSALEGDGLAGKEGGAWQAGGFSLEGVRSGEGAASGTQGAAGASFAERLAEQLRNSAADIVRAGQIVLKDGGEGTIRLALHPETLGAVRIHLEMSGDKRISGKITVSSREAWDAFSESMDSLIAAFADEGFETAAGFDLSWAGRGGESGSGKVSAPFYASSVPDVMHDGDFSDDYSMSAARRQTALYAVDIFA